MKLASDTPSTSVVKAPESFAARVIRPQRPKERRYLETVIDRNRARLKKAWDWYERLGEIHFGVSRSARVAGYTTYEIVRRDGKNPDPTAVAAAAQMYSRFGGTRGLIQRYYTCMKVPGECYLLQMFDEDGNADGLHFASASELEFEPGDRAKIRLVTMPEIPADQMAGGSAVDRMETTLQWKQFLGRAWLPGQQYIDLPDTPMLALLGDCEALDLLKQAIRARIKSRLEMDGILFIPSQLQIARHPFGDAPKLESAKSTGNELLDGIIISMQLNRMMTNRGDDPSPIIISGPGEHGEKIRHIVLDAQIFETDLAYHTQLTANIYQGLDIQKQAVEGTQQANHWGAWAVTDEERRVAVQPDMESLAWVFMRLWIIPQMKEAKVDEADIAQHYLKLDLSGASVRSNMQEDARQGYDRFFVGPEGARRMSGIPDDEAPTELELIRMYGAKHGDPYLATFEMSEADKIDWTKVGKGKQKTGPSADSPADDPESGPGEGDPGSPGDSDTDAPRSEEGG